MPFVKTGTHYFNQKLSVFPGSRERPEIVMLWMARKVEMACKWFMGILITFSASLV